MSIAMVPKKPPVSTSVLNSPHPAAVGVTHALHLSDYSEIRRRVHCQYQQGVLLLDGDVSSYFLKQMAQEIAKTVHGVGRIVNRVRVHDRQARKRSVR